MAEVSIVIPSKDRESELVTCLRSIVAQPTKPLEIIIVDQSASKYRLPNLEGLIHLHASHLSGLTAARNEGIRIARGSIILFLDDDCELLSDCIAAAQAAFLKHPGAVAVALNVLAPEAWRRSGLGKLAHYIFEQGFFASGPLRSRHGIVLRNASGCASAFKRTLFEKELFDERLSGYCYGEDWEFSKRARLHGDIVYASAGAVAHHATATNRYHLQRLLKTRWENFLYFYEKLADTTAYNRLCRLWWMFGESLRWLKAGMGLPRS